MSDKEVMNLTANKASSEVQKRAPNSVFHLGIQAINTCISQCCLLVFSPDWNVLPTATKDQIILTFAGRLKPLLYDRIYFVFGVINTGRCASRLPFSIYNSLLLRYSHKPQVILRILWTWSCFSLSPEQVIYLASIIKSSRHNSGYHGGEFSSSAPVPLRPILQHSFTPTRSLCRANSPFLGGVYSLKPGRRRVSWHLGGLKSVVLRREHIWCHERKWHPDEFQPQCLLTAALTFNIHVRTCLHLLLTHTHTVYPTSSPISLTDFLPPIALGTTSHPMSGHNFHFRQNIGAGRELFSY